MGQVDPLHENHGGDETIKDKCLLKMMKMVEVQTSQEFREVVG